MAALIAAVVFGAIAPTLTWCDFSGGMENFNLETALEMSRDGHWLVPTLDGQVRTRKPPLAEWTTALGMLTPGPLAWRARWPSLLCAALTILAVYELGRLTGGTTLGLVAACFLGSSFLFLKFAREASYDTQLMLWVTLTNVCLSWAILRGRWWTGCAGAGIALGLALMTKGPPGILQTVLPPLGLLAFERWRHRGQPDRRSPAPLGPVLLGIGLMLAISLPWVSLVVARYPGRLAEWWNEVTLGTEARFERRQTVYFAYLAFVLWVAPWTVWFVGGLWYSLSEGRRFIAARSRSEEVGVRLMIAWVLVPLLVMWCFPERRDRYTLPLIPPAAVVAAWALLVYFRQRNATAADGVRAPRWPLAIHWMSVATIGIGLPIAGASGILFFRTVEGEPWFSPALSAAIVLCVVVAVGVACVRLRQPGVVRLAAGTLAIMLIVQAAHEFGYSRSPSGVSQSKRFIQAVLNRYPDAAVYNANNRSRRRDLPLEMTIYLNRVTARAENPGQLRAGPRPQVILFPDGAERPPAGFVLVTRRLIKEEWWNAYVLPPRVY